MLRLQLATIRTPHEHFDHVYQAQAFQSEYGVEGDVFTVVAPVRLSFDVDKDKDQFRLAGSVRTTVELSCSRCLEPLSLGVDAPFDLRYRPRTSQADGGEREIDEEDFSTALYENDEIDLAQLIRERLFLSIPMKPLCREDCRGLCPSCGTNLNKETCSCRREWEDPRFAALRALRKDS
jgi:uncharacterized protein